MGLEMRQHLDLRMEQKLKLTPQMIQSIEILLLPQMALEERIITEIEENPVLEIEDGPDEGGAQGEELDEAPEREAVDGRLEPSPTERLEVLSQRDDPEDFGELLKRRREAMNRDEDAPDKMAAIEATAGPPPSLADHLLDQLRFVDMREGVREVLGDLCWALDRRGYLTVPLEELVDEDRLEDAEEAWELIRGCDPAGVGARDIADCLLLQLEREPGDNSFEQMLIREHLEDLLRNRLPVIAQAVGVEVDRVQEALEVVTSLDPQPGLPYGRSENTFVVPDVVVERDEADDEWVVSIPDSHLPRVKIDESYYQLYDDPATEAGEKAYLKEKLGAARFLLDAVAQRKRTLLKIATEIVKHQQAFLDQGPEHLRPLMRQDIADKIGMHVATVSRAVKDKYIQTPAGVLPLATFFSGGIATQDGSEAESSCAVKLRIKAMIEREDPRKPLSDQAIADVLVKEGLDISRRTVAKYRIAMGIASTRQRRRFAD